MSFCIFFFFFDIEFKSIVEQSNRSHEQQSNNVTDDRWKDITVAEIKEFMGILLVMRLSITATI